MRTLLLAIITCVPLHACRSDDSFPIRASAARSVPAPPTPAHPPSPAEGNPRGDPLAQPFATLRPTTTQVQECTTQPSSSFCRFLSIDADWPAYAAIGAPADKGSLKLVAAALDDKKQRRDLIAKRYFDLAGAVDDEWSVAASCRAAEALLEYANLLLEFEPPPKAPEKNPFIDRLWTMAFPVQEQALQQLDKTAELARSKGVDSAYGQRCAAERAVLTTWLADPYDAPLPLRARSEQRRRP